MTTRAVPRDQLFAETAKQEHRAWPYELWTQLREEPVARQSDGVWVVSGYDEVHALLGDPRMSSDWQRAADEGEDALDQMPFIFTDPPRHESLRRAVMRHFGPPAHARTVAGLEGLVTGLVADELDSLRGRTRMDVVGDFTHAVPVKAICTLVGVPVEDEPVFGPWVGANVLTFGNPSATPEQVAAGREAGASMTEYLLGIVRRRHDDPRDDLISAMVHDDADGGPLSDLDVTKSVVLLFIAGHITTVNATASAILTLLRNPEVLRRVREDPDLVPGAFEEALRLTGPVNYILRVALADIAVGGKVIPAGADVRLHLGAADRDPRRFDDPDSFDPQRHDNQHLAFNGGPHYCFGAPLARMEARVMLTAWLRRVEGPRLVVDPPPYGPAPAFVGPSELLVDYDRIL